MESRAYSRAELEGIFHTSRLDSIKRSLERAGYGFESAGRGEGYTIAITSLPEPTTDFEAFVKRGFAENGIEQEKMQEFRRILKKSE